MRTVISSDAELAVARINQTLALDVSRISLLRSWGGRLRGTKGVVAADPARYLVLPHIVAIAEEFSRRLLLAKTEPQVPQTHRVMELLWLRAEDQAEGRWEEHLKAWKEWHGLPLASEPEYQGLRPFIEARNAIMHGLGELTRRQRRGNQEAALRGLLKSVGIQVAGTRLIINDAAVTKCADACKSFIQSLDLSAQKVP